MGSQMICDLMRENERLRKELRNFSSVCTGSKSDASGLSEELCARDQELEYVMKVNHQWKRVYKLLETRYKIRREGKRQLEYENRDLIEFINRREKRRVRLESENKKLAAAFDAQQSKTDSRRPGSLDGSRQARFEEQYEVLKSQVLAYMEDFKLERKDREKFQEESEMYKRKLNDAEKMIRKLTAQLDACCTALVEAHGGRGNAYRGQSGDTPLRQVRFIHPYHPVDEIWQLQQQRGAVHPRNEQPMPLFYGGEMKSCYSEEL